MAGPGTTSRPRRDPVTRERIVDVAMAMVESEGVDALTMRALSEKLDVAVTSIYWHVGDKDAVLGALVQRIGETIGEVRTTGRTPEARVASTARSLLRALEAHGALVGLAHQRGELAAVFAPARVAVAEELAAAGLTGVGLADATNAVLQYVAAHVLTEAVMSRSPEQHYREVALWVGEPGVDATAARRLEEPPDTTRSFDVGLRALVAGLCSASA